MFPTSAILDFDDLLSVANKPKATMSGQHVPLRAVPLRANDDDSDTIVSVRTLYSNNDPSPANAGRSEPGTAETADSEFVNVSLDHELPQPSPEPDDSVPSIPANDPEFARHIVDWDRDDPKNPYNWSTWSKSIQIFLVSCLTLVVRLGSGMIAPWAAKILRDFGTHDEQHLLTALTVSVYVLGLAAGPLLVVPLSKIFGRLNVSRIANMGFVGFTMGCSFAASPITLIIFRFAAGVFGTSALANGPAVIADLITTDKRAVP